MSGALRHTRLAPIARGAAIAILLLVPASAGAVQVTLPASKDNTLYQLQSGVSSNGAGERFFTGRTKDGFIRRAVIHFDVAAAVPAGSIVNSVSLRLVASRVSNGTARATSLHRLQASWGEGTSNADQQEGQGTTPTTNDATWQHRFYPGTLWAAAGGDFVATASASIPVMGTGAYTWSAAGMVADVQAWVDTPAQNFGWLVKGDESAVETAKRFDSREATQSANRPSLVVDFTPPGGGPTGACCHDDTCDVVTAAACSTLGGTYQGDNTTCTPDPCPGEGDPVTVTLTAIADNTMYESATGAVSNGLGTKVILSKNNAALICRGLFRFDLSAIPINATVQDAILTLYNVEGATSSANVTVHRALASWGEGTSTATGTEENGAAATTGDATWIHRFHPTPLWTNPGGDFTGTAGATVAVTAAGAYAFASASLTTDVQDWIATPAANFGWIVRGKESGGAGSALKRIESRQSVDPARRPKLQITYTVPVVPQLGACCLPSGLCEVHTAADCATAGGTYQGDGVPCATDLCPVVLTPFVDALPIPAVATPVSGTQGGAASYVIPVREVSQRLHRDLPLTRVWGYNGSYPGPTIVATSGVPIDVTWQNDLRDEQGNLRTTHYLPVDLCLHGPDEEGATARIVTHLHGGHVPAAVDGYPTATLLPGQQVNYVYPNNQPPGTTWYHDHALGITRLNVMMGLAGFYLITDAFEQGLGLPSGEYEIGLAIQDRSFHPDGRLKYPATWAEHFAGDKMLVNGKVWPYLQVKQGKYRFRMLNGCNSRFLHLSLSNGAPFQVLGTDLGLLQAPVARTALLLGPGERADVVLDFAGYAAGTQIVLGNDAPAMYPGTAGEGVIPQVMRFDVIATAGHTAPLPSSLRPVTPIDPSEAVATRDFVLRKIPDACTGSMWSINGLAFHDVTEYPLLGTTEIWRFVNDSGVSHPMHMHLVQFQILDRQPFQRVGDEIVPVGSPVPPDAAERGWKDTAPVHPGELLRVITRFEDYAGLYAYHCHMLEHEDQEMMRQFRTVEAVGVSVRDTSATETDGAGAAARFRLVLSAPSPVEVRVTATTQDGEALAGEDYAALSQQVVFAPGTAVQTLDVPLLGDLAAEPDETFRLVLSSPVNASITDGTGIATIVDNDGAVSAPTPEIPSVTFLGGGSPNPFAERVAIEWGLSAPGEVELAIYDVSGRLVRRLENGTLPAGFKTSVWDGRDDSGKSVATGLYFARLRAGGKVHLGRMMRLR